MTNRTDGETVKRVTAQERTEEIHKRISQINNTFVADRAIPADLLVVNYRERDALLKELEELRPLISAERQEQMVLDDVKEMLGKLPLLAKVITTARPEVVSFAKMLVSEVVAAAEDLDYEIGQLALIRAHKIGLMYNALTGNTVNFRPEQAMQILCALIASNGIPQTPMTGKITQMLDGEDWPTGMFGGNPSPRDLM